MSQLGRLRDLLQGVEQRVELAASELDREATRRRQEHYRRRMVRLLGVGTDAIGRDGREKTN